MHEPWVLFPEVHKHGVMARGCLSITGKVEAEESQGLVRGWPGLQETLFENKTTWTWEKGGSQGSGVGVRGWQGSAKLRLQSKVHFYLDSPI